MTKHEVIRAILDAATVTGRLEDAIKVLDDYAEREALNFTNYIELVMTPRMWVKGNGEYKTFQEVYADYNKNSTVDRTNKYTSGGSATNGDS